MAGIIDSYFRGDFEAVKKALTMGNDVNGRNEFHETPLIVAAMGVSEFSEEHASVMKLFVKHPSIDLNLADGDGNTAFHHAAQRGNFKMVELLLGEKSIDVNRPNSDGNTVLHVAANKKENIQMFELILADERVDVNLQHNRGGNVLTVAIAGNNVKAVELILADRRFTLANALVNGEDQQFIALSLAAFKRNWEVLKLLVHHPCIDLDVKNKVGLTLEDAVR